MAFQHEKLPTPAPESIHFFSHCLDIYRSSHHFGSKEYHHFPNWFLCLWPMMQKFILQNSEQSSSNILGATFLPQVKSKLLPIAHETPDSLTLLTPHSTLSPFQLFTPSNANYLKLLDWPYSLSTRPHHSS